MGWSIPWFDSHYYSLLYGHRDTAEARTWVDGILARWSLPSGARVLDMACGRGRHTQWLTAADMRATGIDLSPNSIAEARVRVPGADFHVHDMHQPLADAAFEAVVCLFTSIGYVGAESNDRQVFGAAHTELVPGGRFVLDFMNSDRVLRELVAEEERMIEGICFIIRRTVENDVLVKRITVVDDGKRHDFEERVRTLMPEQLEEMATAAGLVVEDRTDGPGTGPFDPVRSDRFVMWMYKPAI